jgi:hypothetical protein
MTAAVVAIQWHEVKSLTPLSWAARMTSMPWSLSAAGSRLPLLDRWRTGPMFLSDRIDPCRA